MPILSTAEVPMQTLTSRLSPPKLMEHRWGERVQLDCPAWIVLADGTTAEGRVRNASISGAWIETPREHPVYATATVVLLIDSGARRRSIELPACVVRSTHAGVGVEWRDMAVPTLILLLREAGGDVAGLRARNRALG